MVINVGMWAKALRRMPRVTPEEWSRLDIVSRWLIATRAAVLTMTFISCLIAGSLALRDGKMNWLLWSVVTLGLLLSHATNNLLNDLTDHMKGTDKGNYFRTQYGLQPFEAGVMSMRQFFCYISFTGGLALAAGIYLTYVRSGHVLALFLAGVFFVLFYTWPLKYFGLGEVAVVFVWGPLMVGGGYYVITGDLSWKVALCGAVYALGPTQVIFGKHIDKAAFDTAKKIRTLPVLLGEKYARHSVIGMMIVQYLLTIYLVASRYFTPFLLLSFLSLGTFFKLIKVYKEPRPAEKPASWFGDVWPLWFAAWSFLHSARFGLFFLCGLGCELLFHYFRSHG